MKTITALFLIAGSLLLTACEVSVTERRPVTTRRYVSYRDRDPYYRTSHHRHYYEDDTAYRTRVYSRRYYSRGPIDRSYGF